ncbi:MAG: nucleotide exchange factor GrpE [Anaerolineaceae bacterium]|jgi:molecular chaperone GrpE|nr:nucleotide exchange factor GrpE [Anaerolineaceae bacterium]OQY87290.1 MAG: nucleotide exchange factor GrpE [Anaerolineae bacterium UTCFX1]
MTKNKTHPYKQDAEDALRAEGQTQPEIEALQDQLEETTTKLAESVQGWQRAQADFQNYKKRIERDNELMYASMKSDIVKKILPVLDDLERAIQNRPADDAWGLGIDLILRKFQNILQAEGIKRIEATGAEFDPNFHEAISHEPSDEVESHHVIEVVQNGYTLGERVIRPALVRVAQ